MVLQRMSQHSQHQSTALILVPSRPFGLAEQGLLYPVWTFYLLHKVSDGENAWNLLVFDDQSAASFCVDTINIFRSKRSKPFRGSQDTT